MSGFERYLAVESAGGPSWHPDKSRIAFTFNSSGTYQIFSVDIIYGIQSWPKRLSYEVDRCTAPKYLGDGSIIFMRDFGGDENFQIGIIRADGEAGWLTSRKTTKHIIDHVTKSTFYFNANMRDKSRRDAYRFSPVNESEAELIYSAEKGIIRVNHVSPDEKKIILERAYGNDNKELLLYESGSVVSLTKRIVGDTKVRWKAERFIDDDKLLVTTDFKSDFLRLAKLTLSGEFETIPNIENGLRFESMETTASPSSDHTYFLNNEEGYSTLYKGLFGKDDNDKVTPIELPMKGTAVSGDERNFDSSMAVSPDGKYLAVTLASPSNPTNIWVIDLETKMPWRATDVGLVGLNTSSFSGATLHRFNSFDGLSVPFFRYLPKGKRLKRGWPCLVFIHGGPESQYKPDFNPVIQFLISAGFAVIAPNIRGSSGYGRRYLDLDNVEKRLDSIHDIEQLALHLRDPAHGIDTDRFVIYGGSYGGFSVLSSMTEYPDLWKAGVDLFGISNFVTFLKNTASWRRPLREAEYGSLDKDIEVLERISPINKVDRIKAPLFIIQGDRDERVPLSESLQIYESLKSRGVPVKMIRFPDEGHGVVKLENRITAYTALLEWLRQVV